MGYACVDTSVPKFFLCNPSSFFLSKSLSLIFDLDPLSLSSFLGCYNW